VIFGDDDPRRIQSGFPSAGGGVLRRVAEQEEAVESELAGEASELFVGGGGGVPELAHLTEGGEARAATWNAKWELLLPVVLLGSTLTCKGGGGWNELPMGESSSSSSPCWPPSPSAASRSSASCSICRCGSGWYSASSSRSNMPARR